LRQASIVPRVAETTVGRQASSSSMSRITGRLTYAMAYVIVCDMVERHVKLFRNGRNQAVRIPREFELPGEDAIIRKDGPRLILEPAPPQSLLGILAALPTLDEEFPPIEDLPAEPVDL
jgi:antitoxin VapB